MVILGVLGADNNQAGGYEQNLKKNKKKQIRKKHLWRPRRPPETNFCIRNLIKGLTPGLPPCNIIGTIVEMDKGIIK